MTVVLEALHAAGVQPAGPPTTVFHQVPDEDTLGDIAMQIPIAETIESSGGVTIAVIPEQTVAAAVHEGSYSTLGDTYGSIAAWIQEHGYEIAGPNSETYFNSPTDVAESDLLTEVAFPVHRCALN